LKTNVYTNTFIDNYRQRGPMADLLSYGFMLISLLGLTSGVGKCLNS